MPLAAKDGEERVPLAMASIEKLSAHLEFQSSKAFLEWFQGDRWDALFQPFFEAVIRPEQDAAKESGSQRAPGPRWAAVEISMQDAITEGEMKYGHGKSYTEFNTKIEQYAYFLTRIIDINSTHRQGLFWRKHILSEHEKFCCMWEVLMVAMSRMAPAFQQKREKSAAKRKSKKEAKRDAKRQKTGFEKAFPEKAGKSSPNAPEKDSSPNDDGAATPDGEVESEREGSTPIEAINEADLTALSDTVTTPQAKRLIEEMRQGHPPGDAKKLVYSVRQQLFMDAPASPDLTYAWHKDVLIRKVLKSFGSETNHDTEIDPDDKEFLQSLDIEDEMVRKSFLRNDWEDTMPFQVATEADKETYLMNELAQDNKRFQPQGLKKHAKSLRLDPDHPRFDCMPLNTPFKFWQVPAIGHLVHLSKSLEGALLCDVMGLGKTYVLVGYVLYRMYKRERLIAQGKEPGFNGPHLITTLASLVGQTYDAVKLIVGNKAKVYVYHGDMKEATPGNIPRVLTKSDPIFKDDNVIIISTAQVIASRNGPRAQLVWRTETLKGQGRWKLEDAEKAVNYNTLDPNFPKSLDGIWKTVGIDEAHVIKNPNTAQHNAMQWLRGFNHSCFFILITGTPDMNSIMDVDGLARFCYGRVSSESAWGEEMLEELAVDNSVNPFQLPDNSEAADLLRPTRKAISKFILSSTIDPVERGTNLASYYQRVMIRRTMMSEVDGKRIGDDIATVNHKRINCSFSKDEQDKYNAIAHGPTTRLITFNKRTKRAHWNGEEFRHLQLYQFWTGFEHIHRHMMATSTPDLIKRDNLLHYIVSLYCKSVRKAIPEVDDIEAQLRIVCEGSPKIRVFLTTFCDIHVDQGKKMLLVVSLPAQQVLVVAILRALKVNVACYHAGLTSVDKYTIQRAFNNHPTPSVVVGTFPTLSWGGNWQPRCHHGLCFDPANSMSIDRQIKGRLQRIGQTQTVQFITLYTAGTINDRVFANNLRKALPGTIALMNETMFGHGAGNEDDEGMSSAKFDTYKFVQINGTLVRADDPAVQGKGYKELGGIAVVRALMLYQTGQPIIWDRVGDEDDPDFDPQQYLADEAVASQEESEEEESDKETVKEVEEESDEETAKELEEGSLDEESEDEESEDEERGGGDSSDEEQDDPSRHGGGNIPDNGLGLGIVVSR